MHVLVQPSSRNCVILTLIVVLIQSALSWDGDEASRQNVEAGDLRALQMVTTTAPTRVSYRL